MTKDTYIKSTASLLREGKDPTRVLGGLRSTLARHNHERILRQVLVGVQRTLEADAIQSTPTAIFASKKGEQKYKDTLKKQLSALGVTAEPRVVFDESIVGGYTVTYGDMLIDRSYKHSLLTLYRNLAH